MGDGECTIGVLDSTPWIVDLCIHRWVLGVKIGEASLICCPVQTDPFFWVFKAVQVTLIHSLALLLEVCT